MNKPDNKNPIDRPIKDILLSVMQVVDKARRGGQGQLARDLEKLCVYAKVADDSGWGPGS